jgi:putative membrane protein
MNTMMDGWNMNGWGWAWMSLWMVVGAAIVALLVLLLVRGSAPANRRSEQDEAVAILRRRFASGEIDQEEYQHRRAKLEESS